MNAFRIKKCSDPLLWYADRVGDVFACFRMERLTGGDILWTHEQTELGNFTNWVWALDAEEAPK